MIKKITRDPMFLAQKSVDATEADKQVITDLLDTLRANLDHCVGMAANMIGVSKNIIVVAAGPFQFAMINPVITKKMGTFQTEEGCLSLDGVRPCTRYKEIAHHNRRCFYECKFHFFFHNGNIICFFILFETNFHIFFHNFHSIINA